MARSSPSGFARGYSPLPGEVRRSASASPLITPPRTDLAAVPSAAAVPPLAPLGTSLVAALPPAVPPLGSGLSDLRTTVVAQQRQLDGLVDKVASLLSAMHAEVLEDVRKTCRHGGGGPDGGPSAAVDSKDLVRFRDLNEVDRGLRAWMQGQLRETWDRLEGKLREVQYHTSSEVQDVQAHLAGEVHSLRARVSHLEDMTLDDDDSPADLRQHLEVRLEAQTAQVHSSMAQLAAELRQHVQASSADGAAEGVLRQVDERLQEHEAKDGVLGKLRDEVRQEAEARLEAKMTQTFGLTQRLMNELRQELQGQVVQVHEGSQHLAVELRRGLEAQQLHLQASLQQLVRDGVVGGRGAGGKAAAGDAGVEEQLAGCRAAAADCARCAIEAAEATDHMEAQIETFMHRASKELQQELQKGLDELSRSTAEGTASRADAGASSIEASVGELEEEAAKFRAALADSEEAARAASAKSGSVERGLQELAQRLEGELRRDREANEARLEKVLQEQVPAAARKAAEACGAGAPQASAPSASGTVPPALEEELAKVRAEAASSVRSAAEASAKADSAESGLQELSKRLASELKQSAEAQEARLGESLRQLVLDEVRKDPGAAAAPREAPGAAGPSTAAVEEQLASCKSAVAECTRCAGEASAKTDAMESRFKELSERLTSGIQKDVEEHSSKLSGSLQQLVASEVQKGIGERGAAGAAASQPAGDSASKTAAELEELRKGCKAAAEQCESCLGQATAKVEAAEKQLKACGEELQAKLGAEGKRLLDEMSSKAASAPSAAAGAGGAKGGEDDGEAPTLPELAQKFAELDEEVLSHRTLLVALRERVLQADGYQDDEDEESASGSPSGGPPPGARGGMPQGVRSARSESGSSDGFDS